MEASANDVILICKRFVQHSFDMSVVYGWYGLVGHVIQHLWIQDVNLQIHKSYTLTAASLVRLVLTICVSYNR